jgi:hypothetical protein
LKRAVPVVLIVILLAGLSGCNEEHHTHHGRHLRLTPLYVSAVTGAIIGGIVGYQSEEPGEGAAVGAVLFGGAALVGEIDDMNREAEREDDDDDEDEEEVVFQIRNDNGSQTAVVLKKKGSTVGRQQE